MFRIYENPEEFIAKNNEIVESGVCGNATKYADLDSCKHPTKNKWAMPVLHYATEFFTASELTNTLTKYWDVTIKNDYRKT